MTCRGGLLGGVLALLFVLAAEAQGPRDMTAVPTVTVTLRAHASVGIRPVSVGDVAEVTGANAALCKAVADLDVADPLGRLASRTVSRKQVAFRIELAGLPTGLVRLEGADQSEVVAAEYQVSETEVVAATRETVLKRLSSWKPGDIEISLGQPIGMPLTVSGTKEDVTVQTELRGTAPPLGRVKVDVVVLVGGQRRLAFPVYLDVHAYSTVAVVSRQVDKGEWVTESAVIFERRPVDSSRACVTSTEALAGKKARQPLNPGAVLTLSDLESAQERPDRPLIRQNDPVKMIVRLGAVNVVTTGEALQDGRLGQMIRVRNAESKQIVLGRVADRSLVEIEP